MRTITAPERSLLAASRFRIRVRIELEDVDNAWRIINPLGTRDYFIGARWSDTLESPVMMGTLTLSRSVLGLSFAPTMQGSDANHRFTADPDEPYAPFIRGGQKIRLTTACFGAGGAPIADDWKEVFLGVVDDPEWGDGPNFITLAIADIGAFLSRQIITEAKEYSTDDGVPVEVIMQEILDDNQSDRLGPITLYVPDSPLWNIRKFQQAANVSALEAVRALAQQIGWEVRFRYDAAGDFRLTLYAPDRAKTVADTSFGPAEYFQLPSVSENTQDIRNWIRVYFIDKDTGTRMYAEYRNEDSIDDLGELYMEVDEDKASNIDSMVEAQQMADAMGSDLSAPPLTQIMRTSYFWAAQLGDLYAFQPNGVHYDVEQKLAAISIEHVLTRTERSTTIGCRGKPASAYADWLSLRKLSPGEPPAVSSLDFLNFRESKRERDGITYAIDGVTPGVDSIMVYEVTIANPVTADPFQTIQTSVTPAIFTPATSSWKISYPPSDKTKYVQWEVRDANLKAGGVRRVVLQAQGTKPWFVELKQIPNLSGSAVALRLVVNDALLKGGTLKAWVNRLSESSADPTLDPDGSLIIASTPKTVTNADSFDLTGGGTDTLMGQVPVHNGKGKYIFFEFINSDGLSSGIERFTLLANGSVIDKDGELTDNSIKLAQQFASSVQPVQVFATTLPEPAADGTFAFLISTGKMYRRVGGVWTSAVPAVDITGQVVNSQIADSAISTAKFAAGIRPVRIVSALPGSGDVQGDTVFLTTDNKLYRWTGSAWTRATEAPDITGQLATAQIAIAAITADLLAAAAVTTTKISDDAITTPKILAGSITTVKIAAGAVTAVEIAALSIVAGNIAAGAITTAKVAAGAITANEIAADTITAGQIAAGAISTSELAAGAITAVKIAAGTITANEIASATITAANIASATITATQIAASTITASQIAANTIVAGNIAAGAISTSALAAGAVTATKINVASLASISTDMGIVVAGKLTSVNGQSYLDLNATGSNAFLRHATSGGSESLRLNADGSATFGGVVASSSFTTGTANFAGSAVFGGGITVDTVGISMKTGGVTKSYIVWGDAFTGTTIAVNDGPLVLVMDDFLQVDVTNNGNGRMFSIYDETAFAGYSPINFAWSTGGTGVPDRFDTIQVGAANSAGAGKRVLFVNN